jgi:plasmid stabilization system protein ParE
MKLVLRPAAASDLDEAFLWYESQRAGLGEEFLVAVTRVMEVLAESPLQYPIVHRETRRALVRRFPYSVTGRRDPPPQEAPFDHLGSAVRTSVSA